jgi:hypothetical protein
MTAAGIEHSHLDDAHLTAAIQKSSECGVWMVDEKGAREWIDLCDHVAYVEQRARRAEENAQDGKG